MLNFYQKIYVFVTLLVLAITAIIFFVCITPPYSDKFIVESIAVFVSEIIFGLFSILLAGKEKYVMFHAIGYEICAFLFFCFTLLMAFFVRVDISFRLFSAIHMIGFLLLLFLVLFFYMTEYNMIQQNTSDSFVRNTHNDMYNAMKTIYLEALVCFPDDHKLKERLQFLLEEFHYAADPSEKTEEQDHEIKNNLSLIKDTLKNNDKEMFTRYIIQLEKVVKLRKDIL